MTARRIAVTGASGFIGRPLVRHLHACGREVTAVSRHAWPAPAGVRCVHVPAYSEHALHDAFAGADAVVHLAALAHRRNAPEADFASSVAAVDTAVRAAALAGVRRFLFMSSIGVNGTLTHGRPFTEDTPPQPVEPYARSKVRAEQAVISGCSAAGMEYVILRPPGVYGPHMRGNIGLLVKLVRKGVVLPFGAIRNARTMVGIDNLVDLVMRALDHPAAANQLFLAGDGEDLSTTQFIRHLGEGVGKPARLLPVPPSVLTLGATLIGHRRVANGLCGDLQVDTSKVRRLLGWNPPLPPAEGVRRAAAAKEPHE
ncbi:MAG TPA: NAD-dependent epimerase/dehydratase family protein [Ramlibacter sp.]|jgi:nucleoside-diphosphate-sugar epimerase|nr:NAD-dependent epimerase/dehydratase family protein [Ramlibacter sp.]